MAKGCLPNSLSEVTTLLKMILTRLLRGLVTLAIVTVLVFVLLRSVPGDTAAMLAGGDATEEQIEELREMWGLNKGLGEQFIIYVRNLLKGDTGWSYQYLENGKPLYTAMELVLLRIPNTILLAIAALIIALIVAIPMGVFSAIKPGGIIDNIGMTLTFTIQSFPIFFIGMLLIMIFSLWTGLLPSGGSGKFINLILPAVTLSAHTMAQLLRVTRTEVGRVMDSDFIRTSRAKGLSTRNVIFKHGLRNAMIPLVTVIGLRFGALLHGAVICETLFRWPGIGNLLITSLNSRDYAVVQILVPYTAFIFIILNITVDILYGILDPRIRVK